MFERSEVMSRARRILESGGLRPAEIYPDKKKHRCPVEGKPKALDGLYIIHPDQPTTVFWKNYRTGQSGSEIIGDGTPFNENKQQPGSFSAAKPLLTDHPYLISKGLTVLPGLRILNGNIVVPAYDLDGSLRATQSISPEGKKLFQKGGKVKGASFPFKGEFSNPIYLAEGLATAASVWLALNKKYAVRACFSAGNLAAVAEKIKTKYPGQEIIFCADNDRKTPGNPGLNSALTAAKTMNGKVALATFFDDEEGSDFNDLHALRGLSEVSRQLKIFVKKIEDSGLKVFRLKDFLSLKLSERGHLLYPVIPEQGLIILFAPRGQGKTYVAISIALVVASGSKMFKWLAPRPFKVLYLDGEMPANTMQERLSKLVAGLHLDSCMLDNFMLITPDTQNQAMPNLATSAGQASLEPYLSGVSLLIIDNLATLCRSGRENETESWLPVQGWLLDLRRRGISVLLVHHAGKSGDQRGTSAKEDIMDTVINLRRPKSYCMEDGARFEVHLTKARGLSGEAVKAFEAQLLDYDGGLTWRISSIEDPNLETVKDLLADGFSIRDIAEKTGLSRSAVHRLKQKIEEE